MNCDIHLWSYLAPFCLQWEFFSGRSCRENQNTHFIFKHFFFLKNRVVYEIMWKNIVEPDIPHGTIWCIPVACWIAKDTNTHSEYVIFIAFRLQQWLHERAKMSRSTYIDCLVHSFRDLVNFVFFKFFSEYLIHFSCYSKILNYYSILFIFLPTFSVFSCHFLGFWRETWGKEPKRKTWE